MQKGNKLYQGDCLNVLPEIETDSIDAIVTDPPYGISFMGKDWDKAVPSIAIWRECLRILKPGAFAFVMCIPRQDCLARMICRLEDAGFNIAFSSIYHTFATGFPKSQNLSKAADTRAGAKREIIAKKKGTSHINPFEPNAKHTERVQLNETAPATPHAKALDGAYSGFQPKPAVEVIIVAMKPIEEKAYLDQAIANKHGCTWLDDCRIPYISEDDKNFRENDIAYRIQNNIPPTESNINNGVGAFVNSNNKGRFPANVLCEDDVLNDGRTTKSAGGEGIRQESVMFKGTGGHIHFHYGDNGSFSRYFSLDAWFAERIKRLPKEAQKTFPWLIVPKASAREKTKHNTINPIDNSDTYSGKFPDSKADKVNAYKHPTIKPIKLMSWLITLASRESDIILDPFCGSGTTLIAAKMLGRQYIGIELEKEYYDIARLRIDEAQRNIDKFL